MQNVPSRRFFMLLTFLTPFLFGGVCEMVPASRPIEPEYVQGVFVADFDAGLLDMIDIKDSIYVHTFVSIDGTVRVDTAECEFSYFENDKSRADLFLYRFVTRFPFRVFSGNDTGNPAVLDTTPTSLILGPYLDSPDPQDIRLVRRGSRVGGDHYVRPGRD